MRATCKSLQALRPSRSSRSGLPGVARAPRHVGFEVRGETDTDRGVEQAVCFYEQRADDAVELLLVEAFRSARAYEINVSYGVEREVHAVCTQVPPQQQ